MTPNPIAQRTEPCGCTWYVWPILAFLYYRQRGEPFVPCHNCDEHTVQEPLNV